MTASPKKLAIVSNVAAPYRVSQHLRIARELEDEVELWSLILFEHDWLPWKHELPTEIRPVVFGKGEAARRKHFHPLRQWSKMGKIIQFLCDRQIDMVIMTGANDLGRLRLLSWCKRTGLPNFIFGDSNIRGDQATGLRRLVRNTYVSYAVKCATGVLPCGVRGKEYFERYGSAGKPCFYMPHEPDYQRIFSIGSEERQRVQEKFHLKAHRKYVMFSGRLVHAKGIDTLLDAFQCFARQRPDWDLLIVGGGTLENDLKQRVPDDLRDRIVWTGFVSDQAELAALYHCAEVFVLPSRFEPWAVVVCEAAAAGLAVITSDMVGAGAELCKDGVNGAQFPANDASALTEKLLWITERPGRLTEMRYASLRVLDDWRRRGDPVQGVRQAMAFCGLLDPPPPVIPMPPTPSAPTFLHEQQPVVFGRSEELAHRQGPRN